jgi:hypothetical protein
MLEPSLRTLIGSYVYHQDSTPLGSDLLGIICDNLLKVMTTFHSSTRLTWSRGVSHSQLDYVLVPLINQCCVRDLRGAWTKLSDHKLIFFDYVAVTTGTYL